MNTQIGKPKRGKVHHHTCGVAAAPSKPRRTKDYSTEPDWVFVSATLPALELKLAAIRP